MGESYFAKFAVVYVFGGAFFVSLFGSGLLAVDFQAALQNVNFVNVMVGIMMVMLGKTGWDMLVQG